MITIRSERPTDVAMIDDVHRAAFPTDAEARLVALLREHQHSVVSLVAEQNDAIVGHVLFSPVTLAGCLESGGLGLAPVAVKPAHQRRGIASSLIEAGLKSCRQTGSAFVVVLGDPAFYHRFGFRRASDHRLGNEYGVDDEFMVLELQANGLSGKSGLIQYGPEFSMFLDS